MPSRSAIFFSVLLLGALWLAVPDVVLAQGIVAQCAGIDCQLCHLFGLFNNVIQYAIFLGSVIAAGMFTYAGALFIFAMGDTGKIAAAKRIFGTVLRGYVIALLAVLAVDVIVNSVARKEFAWKSVPCQGGRVLEGGLTFKDPAPIVVIARSTGAVSPEGLTVYDSASGQRFSSPAEAAALLENVLRSNGVPYTEDGNKACAWAVNQLLTRGGYDAIDGLSVPEMKAYLDGPRGTIVPIEQAMPGDIIIRGDIGHVGMCKTAQCADVLSNSSSAKVLRSQRERDFAVNQHGQRTTSIVYRPTRN